MVILKNIPRILSPELLSVLARMGHGDEIVLADANFPSASVAKAGPELVSFGLSSSKLSQLNRFYMIKVNAEDNSSIKTLC